MSQLIDNLNTIVSIKSDIKSAIENKGVDMTGVSFGSYADKIGEISGGGGVNPSGTLEISENGVYDVYSYASANVDVHPSASLSETYISNGNYNITGEFNGGVIIVDVPAPQFVTETLSVSANGTYTPSEGIDGYSQVVVDVPISGWDQKSFTEGTIEIINLDNSASFIASNAFRNNKTIQTVNLPYATTVGYDAFLLCISLTQINLPVCSYISGSAFQACNSLSQVSLPVCSYINDYAFYACNSLSQINLPLCEYIGNSVFFNCHSLTQVDLPECSYIGNSVFFSCHSLTQVNIPKCSYIGDWTFYACYSLTQVDLPECSYIGNSVFNFCSSLSQVSLPVCSYIGDYAFFSCVSLTQVNLPICSSIGDATFRGCSSLSIITIGYSSVCSLRSSNVFLSTQITSSTGSIYVPSSLVNAYKSTKNWSYFSTQIFPISE